jgi:hypothetical protein
MTDETAPIATPAYLPWKTFLNTLDALAHHMPNRIDRTAFPGQSGSGQYQILLAFRFFGLIGDDGRPTPVLLGAAVADESARKAAIRKLIEQKYAPLFALNLTKTTPAEFAEEMTRAYNVSGDTRLKATRFFLAAAEYLGIEVSKLLLRDRTKPTANGTIPRRRRAAKAAEPSGLEQEDFVETDREAFVGEARSVELRSGGTLTLSASTKFLSLSAADRKFVFDLIDQLEAYEAGGEQRVQ